MAIGMPWFLSFLTAVILFVGIYSFRVYDSEHMESYNEQIIRTIVGTIIGFVIILLFYVFIPQYINRFIFIYNFIFALIALPIIHITEYKIYVKRKSPINYLVIGRKEEMEDILEEISKKTLNKKRFVDFINPSPTKLDKIVEERILNEDIRDKARDNKKYKYKKNIQQKIDRILVADPYLEELVKPKLKEYKRKGIKVEYLPNMVEKDLKRIPIKVAEKFKKYYEVAFEQIEESPGKRILDIFISTVSLIILSPFLLIISLIILLEDKLPIVFKQERVGINENPFTMHKFRSMKNEDKSKAKFASDEQHRILKIGKIMRPIRLDETLQFIDIFRGVMSFVGPRPEQVKFVEEYNELIPFYYARHKLKPGLTGWAQIMYQYAATLEQSKEKLSYDLYYVKNRNSVLDIQIILKTVEAVVWKRGAM
jgi:exopolysaccharide biosynthesis polyprenyl glycosylphosphotransferase